MTTLDASSFPHLLDEVVYHADHSALLSLRATCRGVLGRVDALMARQLAVSSHTCCVLSTSGLRRGRHPAFMHEVLDSRVLALIQYTEVLDVEGLVPPSLVHALLSRLGPSATVVVRPSPDLLAFSPYAPESAGFTPPLLPPTCAAVLWTCDLSLGAMFAPPPALRHVFIDIVCGPRNVHSSFHWPEAHEYTLSFRGPHEPTAVNASVLAFILGQILKRTTQRWTIVDTPEVHAMLPADDEWGEDVGLAARLERTLTRLVVDAHGAARAQIAHAAMQRVQVVSPVLTDIHP